MTHEAIDCQGFAGGFTCGVVQAGFKLVGKRELPGGFGAYSCLVNRHILGTEWDYEEAPWQEWTPKDVPFVFGNPPCSGFSLLSHKGFRGPDSPINSCMWALVQFAKRCNPQVVAFESVQGAFKQGMSLMHALREELGSDWYLYHVLHNGFSVGGAAIRRRYFFLVSRIPFGVDTFPLERVPLVRDVIGDLVGTDDMWEDQPYPDIEPSWWVKEHNVRRDDGLVDGCKNADSVGMDRVKRLIELGGWDHGEILGDVARRVWETRRDEWPAGEQSLEKWAAKDFRLGYNQTYRWYPDRACRVVTGAACGVVVHPMEPRCLNLREVYRIQGFPDNWFIEPAATLAGTFNKAASWPGKGIPVQAGHWLATWVQRALDGEPGPYQGEVVGRRERIIDITHDWKRLWDARNHVVRDSRNDQLRRRMEERPTDA